MKIREVRESELEEMIDLQCLVSRPDGQERFRQYVRGDSSYRLDQTRVVVADGRIVSTLRVWERRMRIGACALRTGGIGGVGTHPDYRGRGYATSLMRDAVAYMEAVGYDVGLLFSIISCAFYRRVGWESLPLAGFRVSRRKMSELEETDWEVQAFDEERDLEQVAALYETCNAGQSGSIVRSRAHWDTAPARIRGILPTVVARRGDALGGYLNFRVGAEAATVREVTHDREDPTVLKALVNYLLQVCEEKGVGDVCGEIPHRHPLVDLLVEGGAGDFSLTGTTSAMVYPVNLPALFRRLLPDLQSRLDASGQTFGPLYVRFEVNDQQCVLRLHRSGALAVSDVHSDAEPVSVPGAFFWRALFGESSWGQLGPVLQARKIAVVPEISRLLSVLFPHQEVILWGPDHF